MFWFFGFSHPTLAGVGVHGCWNLAFQRNQTQIPVEYSNELISSSGDSSICSLSLKLTLDLDPAGVDPPEHKISSDFQLSVPLCPRVREYLKHLCLSSRVYSGRQLSAAGGVVTAPVNKKGTICIIEKYL